MSRKKTIVSLLAVFIIFTAMKGDKPAYKLFNENGKIVKYTSMIKDAAEADIIFFGELHDNPISHWLELQITKEIHTEKEGNIVLGAEMFESDNQLILDEYLDAFVKTKNFEKEARLWKNYSTDYKPLVEFAKENDLDFIATNIPRRYAALVNKRGFEVLDSLSDDAKKLIAPLPIDYDAEVNCYKSMIEMMGGLSDHVTENIPKAQAIKDATMAHFIMESWSKGQTFIHYNGSYHSDNHEGIVWWLKQKNPALNIITLTTLEQDTINSVAEESIGKADYIIVVPSDMTKTY